MGKKRWFWKVSGFDTSLTGPEDGEFGKKVCGQEKSGSFGEIWFWGNKQKVEQSTIEQLGNLTTQPVIYHNEAEFNLKKYLAKNILR